MTLAFLAIPVTFATAQTKPVALEKSNVAGELVVKYSDRHGHNFELVNDFAGRIVLRTALAENNVMGDKELETLKSEVMRLVSTSNPTALGKTGYYFVFTGKYPIWGPHQLHGPGEHFECIYFAEGAIVRYRVIRAWGKLHKPVGYYPYPI